MSEPPKLFISYSWSSEEHEAWVIRLAEALLESGVDVVLDKWDLKEGHDNVAAFRNLVPELLALSKCRDYVTNKGHYFGTSYLAEEPGLTDVDKRALIAFLKTL